MLIQIPNETAWVNTQFLQLIELEPALDHAPAPRLEDRLAGSSDSSVTPPPPPPIFQANVFITVANKRRMVVFCEPTVSAANEAASAFVTQLAA